MLPKLTTFTPFYLEEGCDIDWSRLEDVLKARRCPPIEDVRGTHVEGFDPVTEEDGMVLAVQQFRGIVFRLIEKKVPGAVLKEALAARVRQMEKQWRRRITREEKKELKELIADELVAKAFPQAKNVPVLIDTDKGRVLVGAAGSLAETALACLRRALGSLPAARLSADLSSLFKHWVAGSRDLPPGWEKGGKLTLAGEARSKVAYADIDLMDEDVQERVRDMRPTQLSIFIPDRMTATLKADSAWANIRFLAEYSEDALTQAGYLFYLGSLTGQSLDDLEQCSK